MVEKLRVKLKSEGRTLKWFCQQYLGDYKYQTIMQQINEFSPVQDYLKIAIREYLES